MPKIYRDHPRYHSPGLPGVAVFLGMALIAAGVVAFVLVKIFG